MLGASTPSAIFIRPAGIWVSPTWIKPLRKVAGGQHHLAAGDLIAIGGQNADNHSVL